jgi:hypothetical protein
VPDEAAGIRVFNGKKGVQKGVFGESRYPTFLTFAMTPEVEEPRFQRKNEGFRQILAKQKATKARHK